MLCVCVLNASAGYVKLGKYADANGRVSMDMVVNRKGAEFDIVDSRIFMVMQSTN